MRALLRVVMLLVWACTAQAEGLRLLTTDVPPLAFSQDGRLTGFCIEVVREIQRRLGEAAGIESLPWTRAYQIGLSEPDVVLICPKRTGEREALFKWVGPLLESRTSFYALRGAGIHLASLEQARQASGVLLPRTFYSYTLLQHEGFTNLVVSETPLTAMRMLLAGRCPLLAIDELQVPELLRRAGASQDAVERVFQVAPARSYLSFSLNVPDRVVARWQAELDRMKQDGSFARLHRQWLGH